MRITTKETIEAWQQGNKKLAYEWYLKDEGCKQISFDIFCASFPLVIAIHKEWEEIEKADSQFSWGE